MDLWAYTNGVTLDFSRRGKPTDNATIESFNGRFREECLNVHWLRRWTMRSRRSTRFDGTTMSIILTVLSRA
jgi:transposase InsO family protein